MSVITDRVRFDGDGNEIEAYRKPVGVKIPTGFFDDIF